MARNVHSWPAATYLQCCRSRWCCWTLFHISLDASLLLMLLSMFVLLLFGCLVWCWQCLLIYYVHSTQNTSSSSFAKTTSLCSLSTLKPVEFIKHARRWIVFASLHNIIYIIDLAARSCMARYSPCCPTMVAVVVVCVPRVHVIISARAVKRRVASVCVMVVFGPIGANLIVYRRLRETAEGRKQNGVRWDYLSAGCVPKLCTRQQ